MCNGKIERKIGIPRREPLDLTLSGILSIRNRYAENLFPHITCFPLLKSVTN
jgi:hypothetical protein